MLKIEFPDFNASDIDGRSYADITHLLYEKNENSVNISLFVNDTIQKRGDINDLLNSGSTDDTYLI